MAITKIHAIKTTLDKSIKYICNPDKTDGQLYVNSFACSPQTADIDFKYALDHTKENTPNKAYHLIQSFAPDEVTFDEAAKIGTKLADELLKGYHSYVIATHIDKEHIHNHIVFCAANNRDYSKYNDCKKSYYHIRNISDRLCKEHNLSVITPADKGVKYKEWLEKNNNNSWKEIIRRDINKFIKSASDFEEFILLMKAYDYDIKQGKYLSFKAPNMQRYVRCKTLGKNYNKTSISKKIAKRLAKYDLNKTELQSTDIGKIFDTDVNERYQKDSGYRKWITKENLKTATATYNKMLEKNISSYSDLISHIEQLQNKLTVLRKKIKHIEHKQLSLKETIKYAIQYQDTEKIAADYKKAKNKEAFFRKNETQLILNMGAKNVLKSKGYTSATINVIALKVDYNKLQKQKENLQNSSFYNDLKTQLDELNNIKTNLDSYIDNSIYVPNNIKKKDEHTL